MSEKQENAWSHGRSERRTCSASRCSVAKVVVYAMVAIWRSRTPLSRATSVCSAPFQVESCRIFHLPQYEYQERSNRSRRTTMGPRSGRVVGTRTRERTAAHCRKSASANLPATFHTSLAITNVPYACGDR